MNIQERAAKVLQEIDAAIALAEKATKGPWHVDRDNSIMCGKTHSIHSQIDDVLITPPDAT